MQRFGQKLRSLRIAHGMTLMRLATALGHRAHGHISEIEAGKKVPTAPFVLAVAELFGETTDNLLRDELELTLSGGMGGRAPMDQSVPFCSRLPTANEIERLRLILSTYQDGTGMLAAEDGRTLPGWRDFERSVSLAFDGIASESKDIFDVRLPDPWRTGLSFGVSCKMRRELSRVGRDGRVTLELSNSARKFWDHLNSKGLYQHNYKTHPRRVGQALIELVTQWHEAASIESGGDVDLSKSLYLTLSWSADGWYQLHQFPLALPDPDSLQWAFPTYVRKGLVTEGNHLAGNDGLGNIFEWYGESGGQLKYYPLTTSAAWESAKFRLEPLPRDREHGIVHKAKTYFPRQWAALGRP